MTPKENEAMFQIELKLWRATNEKKHWDNMWFCVYECCSNLAKARLKGVKAPDFEGKVMDSVIKVMDKIKEGEDPGKLSSFCYWPVFGTIFDRKLQKEERTLSWEAWQECEYAKEEGKSK